MSINRNLKYVIFSILVFIILYFVWYFKWSIEVSEYLEPEIVATHYNGSNYVGSQTCLECHADIYNSHLSTNHFNTSSFADIKHIKGSINIDSNELNLRGVRLKMIEEDDNYFQLSKAKFGDTSLTKSQIDIVIGSGVKGQSYLSWEGDELFQLQASYFKSNGSWVNSPNFPDYSFTREVDDNCIKCHVTFAKNKDISGIGNSYDRTKIILGIDCERCHGPSEKHVKYHRSNPEVMSAKFVDNFNKYSRQQRLDACAVCHSGLQSQQIKGNPFSFLAGDTLALFSKNVSSYKTTPKLDVHGNQYGLLVQSKCYVESNSMDCITCHDPHKNQRSDFNYFNAKCISCHSNKLKLIESSVDHDKNRNCISCHMPNIPSDAMKISLDPNKKQTPVNVRTHLIGIY